MLQFPLSGANLTVSIQTASYCFWTLSNLPVWISDSGSSSGAGSATVTLAAAPNNTGSPLSATISIAGAPISITQAANPIIFASGVVNAASAIAGAPLAPGSIATAYGSFQLTSAFSASLSPLPTILGQFSLLFGGETAAPLFFADSGQVNFQVPWELAGQSQSLLSASLYGQGTGGQTVSLAPFAPGIFSMNGQGVGQGAVLDTSYNLVDSANPATAGSTTVQIYCTGLGAVTNQPPSGFPPATNGLSQTITIPTVNIGGLPAQVLFSGLAPGSVGEYQINALVPAGSSKGAAVPVVIAIGGSTSNTVTIAVQ